MTLNTFKQKLVKFDNEGHSHAYVTCAYCNAWLTTLNVRSAIRYPRYAHTYTTSCYACGQTAGTIYMKGVASL